MASVTPPLEAAICDMPIIPWKPEFHTMYSPSVLVFTLAIGWYYLNGMWAPNSTVGGTGWLLPFFFIIVLAGIQTAVIGKQKACPPTVTYGLIAAWVIGIASGTIGYWVAYYFMLPGTAVSAPATVQENFGLLDVNSGVSFQHQKKGTATDPSSAVNLALPSSADHCKVPDDDTYYVDLYKDGQLITESIGEKLLS